MKFRLLNSRRKTGGVVVDSAAQLRLSVPIFFMLFVQLIVFGFNIWRQSEIIYQLNERDLSPGVVQTVLEMSHSTSMIEMLGITISSMAGLILWLYMSHRIFGAVVPLRRQIEKLINGNYDDKVTLRRYDELRDIETDLNRLTETLRSKNN